LCSLRALWQKKDKKGIISHKGHKEVSTWFVKCRLLGYCRTSRSERTAPDHVEIRAIGVPLHTKVLGFASHQRYYYNMAEEVDEIERSRLCRDIGERGLLEKLSSFVAGTSHDVVVGFGDDAAVVAHGAAGEFEEILTTDMLVEGTHFRCTDDTDFHLLGRKAIVANVSDIAAMGGAPRFVLVSLALSGDMPLGCVLELYRGMDFEARRWGALLVGGDTVFCPHMALNIALTGRKPARQQVPLRSNCRAGQHVYISGNLGASRAGLRLLEEPMLEEHRDLSYGHRLVMRHLQPEPRPALGQALAATQPGLAMIDISDSLFNELHLLARASRCGFRIEVGRIPASAELRAFCGATGEALCDYTLFSGEEYELLFSTHMDEVDLLALLHGHDIATPVHRIGEVTDGNEVVFVDRAGVPLDLKDLTFRHFE
jgi:thiamine-monophosphate kinase